MVVEVVVSGVCGGVGGVEALAVCLRGVGVGGVGVGVGGGRGAAWVVVVVEEDTTAAVVIAITTDDTATAMTKDVFSGALIKFRALAVKVAALDWRDMVDAGER